MRCHRYQEKLHFGGSSSREWIGGSEKKKTIVKGIKKRLGNLQGNWVDKLQDVLRLYRTTIQTPTKETPFNLVYRSEAVIPIEVSIRNTWTSNPCVDSNNADIRVNMDQLKENRIESAIWKDAYKAMTERYYKNRVQG